MIKNKNANYLFRIIYLNRFVASIENTNIKALQK